ncbi:transcriptional regulator [Anopheles sinensis]|uniref:Transcriptional regulator n=1 Tax=Anopheles sinensis TaxID=74873 RepID=A0A084VXX6_ANOSI|nr:transcriptional regulator [Anopheles sinensis]
MRASIELDDRERATRRFGIDEQQRSSRLAQLGNELAPSFPSSPPPPFLLLPPLSCHPIKASILFTPKAKTIAGRSRSRESASREWDRKLADRSRVSGCLQLRGSWTGASARRFVRRSAKVFVKSLRSRNSSVSIEVYTVEESSASYALFAIQAWCVVQL